MPITLTIKEDASKYSRTIQEKIQNPHDKVHLTINQRGGLFQLIDC